MVCSVGPPALGLWHCAFDGTWMAESIQREGCAHHRYIPALLANVAELVDADAEENVVFYKRKSDGSELINGRAGI